MIRAFVAATLSPSADEEMTKVQALLTEAGGDIRWVDPRNFHLTFKFLGDITYSQVDRVLTALQNGLSCEPALRVRIRGLGAFPSLDRPRVVWVRVSGPGLKELAAKLDKTLASHGVPAQRGTFHPHITLGRVRSGREGWQVLARVKQYLEYDVGESSIEAVSMYESKLRRDGAVYTALGTVPLDIGVPACRGSTLSTVRP